MSIIKLKMAVIDAVVSHTCGSCVMDMVISCCTCDFFIVSVCLSVSLDIS